MATGTIDTSNEVRSQKFTALGKDWTFIRVGKIVQMNAIGDAKNVSAGTVTLFTLPSWLVPLGTIQVGPANQITESAFLMIYSSDGRVTHYQAAAHTTINDSYSTTYIARD